jgi:hypothetical protein
VTRKFLEEYCKQYDPGLDRKHLSDLRDLLAVSAVEERRLSDGFSYFPSGASTTGRILKIVDWGRLFLEFNLHFNISETGADRKDIVWLDDTKRRDLHAGGVWFCYVGKDAVAAENMIKAALESKFGLSYNILPKSKRPKAGSVKLIEKAVIVIPPGEKGEEIAAVLKGFCKKYGVEPVPVYKLIDCLSPDVPMTVIAFEFSKKQRELFPPGFIIISLKDLILSGKAKGLNSFEEVKEVARELASRKL